VLGVMCCVRELAWLLKDTEGDDAPVGVLRELKRTVLWQEMIVNTSINAIPQRRTVLNSVLLWLRIKRDTLR
jgi:hypothetical protein